MKKFFSSYKGRKFIISILKNVHLFCMMALFVWMWENGYKQTLVGWYPYLGDMAIVFGYCVIFTYMFQLYNGLDVGKSRISELLVSQGLTYTLCAIVFYIVYFFYYRNFFNPVPILLIVVCQVGISIIWCVLITRIYFKLIQPARTLLFYSKKEEAKKLFLIKYFELHYNIVKAIDVNEYDTSRISEDIRDMHVVFCNSNSDEFRDQAFFQCLNQNIKCYYVPKVSDLVFDNSGFDHYFTMPILSISIGDSNGIYPYVKRFFDIVLSFIAIVVLSPVLLITAIAIKLYDGGPAIYKQVRLTKDGKRFVIYKFRSMVVDAEKDGVARLATENDNRITPIGKFIRACRIDELPQLFCILMGTMSIVGPRPERPELTEEYSKAYANFPLRLKAKAGLTGLAQVYGQYNTEPLDKLKMDIIYINHMSLKTDLLLIFLTVKTIFMKDSTAGIDENKVNALFDSNQPQQQGETE